MALFANLFGMHQTSAQPGFFHSGYSTDAGTSVSEWNAVSIPAVYACVGLISDAIAQLPVRVYRELSDGTRERVQGHPVEDLLNVRPNPRMTAFAYRKTTTSHTLLWGNGYSEIQRRRDGQPAQLWLALPDRTAPTLRQDGTLLYETTVDGETKTKEVPDMLHVPAMGFDGVVGYSPVAVARQAMGLARAQEEFAAKFFGNDAKSAGFIKHPGKLSPDAVKNIRDSFDEQGGLENAHRPKVLEEGMEFQQTTIPPEDAQFLECVAAGTPVSMADGTRRRADEICEGDWVLGWDGGPVPSRVAAVGTPPIKPLVRVTTARGRSLVVTHDHPFLAKRAMRTPGGRHDNSEAEWINADSLSQGSFLRVGLGASGGTDEEVDPQLCWLLGVLTGDGYIRASGLSFTSADDKVTEAVEEALSTIGGGLRQKSEYDFDITTGGVGRRSSKVRELLNDSGLVGSHSPTKRVPESVMRAGHDGWAAFLSGYLDADGSVTKENAKGQPYVYWCSTSYGLLEDCQHLLAMLGINAGIYAVDGGGKREVMGQMCDAKATWGLYVTGYAQLRALTGIITPRSDKKAYRLNRFEDLPESKYYAENWQYDRVVSVEQLGEGETVGIEIEETHTHVTAGLVTHNSRDFQVAEIARIYRVPLHMIQSVNGSTSWGSGIAEMSMGFVRFTLDPWMIPIEQEMNHKLFTQQEREQGYYVRHDTSDLLRGDLDARSSYYTAALDPDTGWLTREEVRAAEDRDPLSSGDDARFNSSEDGNAPIP